MSVSAVHVESNPDYLGATLESPDNTAFDSLVAELDSDPIAIAEWVRENIAIQPYAHCRKGALGAFHTGRGNTWDQCALLVSLLRSADIPCRFALAGTSVASDSPQFVFVEAQIPESRLTGIPSQNTVWIPLTPWIDEPFIDVSAHGDDTPGQSRTAETVKNDAGLAGCTVENPLFGNADAAVAPPPECAFDTLAVWHEFLMADEAVFPTSIAFAENRLADYLAASGLSGSAAITGLMPVPYSRWQSPLMAAPVPPVLFEKGADVFRASSFAALGRTVCTDPGCVNDADCPCNNWYFSTVGLQLYRLEGDPAQRVNLNADPITLCLPELNGKTLSLSCSDDGQGGRLPQLRLDGQPISGVVFSSIPSGTDTYTVVFFYDKNGDGDFNDTDEELPRPEHSTDDFIILNFDMYGVSRHHITELEETLQTLEIPDETSTQTELETYLGTAGDLMACSYFRRWLEAVDRANNLYSMIPVPGSAFTFIQMYVDPNTLRPDNSVVLGSTAAWNMDTRKHSGGSRPALRNYSATYPETGDSAARASLEDTVRNVYMFASSDNEARVFENWQGTAGLSTVSALRQTLLRGGKIARIEKLGAADSYDVQVYDTNGFVSDDSGTETAATLTDLFTNQSDPYSAERIASLITELGTCECLVLPIERSVLYYTDHQGNPLERKADVYISFSQTNGDGYMFALDGEPVSGGGSADYSTFSALTSYDGWTVTGDASAPPEFTSTDYAFAANSTSDPGSTFIDDFFSYDPVGDITSLGSYSGNTFDNDFVLGALAYADSQSGSSWSDFTVSHQPSASQTDPSYNTTLAVAQTFSMSYVQTVDPATGQWNEPFSYLSYIKEEDGRQMVETINDPRQNARESLLGDPVNIVTGEFYIDEKADLAFAGGVLPLAVARNYRSRSGLDGPFGYGWNWIYGETLAVLGKDRLLYITADQRLHHIVREAGTENWTPPVGSEYIVERTVSGSDVDAGQFILHYSDLTERTFYPDGYLKQVVHPDGEALTITYQTIDDGDLDESNDRKLPLEIRDASGRKITFVKCSYRDDRIGGLRDSAGRTCEYVYGDGSNGGEREDLVGFTDAENATTSFLYYQNQPNSANNHNIARITLPEGDFLEVFYTYNDRVAFHRNSAASVFNFQYSPYNRFAETWNESGYYRKVFWNENHDVIRVLAEDRSIVRRSFDAEHNLIAETDANGNVTVNIWDARRNLVSTHRLPCKATCFPAPDETVKWAEFDHEALTLTIHEDGQADEVYPFADTDPGTTDYVDLTPAQQRALGGTFVGFVREYDNEDADPNDENRFYQHNSLVVTDPGGNSVSTTFDAAGRPGDIEFPSDAEGNKEKIHNTFAVIPGTSVTALQTSVRQADTGSGFADIPETETTRTYVSGLPPLVETVTDGYENTVTYTYENSETPTECTGYGTSVRDPAGSFVHSARNSLGQIVSQSIPTLSETPDAVPQTVFTRDANHRLTAVISPDKAETSFKYAPARDIVNNADIEYTTDPLGYSTHTVRDPVGNITAVTDRRGHTTRTKCDSLNRPRLLTDPMENSTRLRYDGNGNRVSKTDPRENETTFQYDHNNRQTVITDAKDNDFQRFYDSSGNLVRTVVTVTDPDAENEYDDIVTVYTYDARNRLVAKTVIGDLNQNGDWDSATEEKREWLWKYDAIGRKTKAADPAGHYTRWIYDAQSATSIALETGESDPDSRSYSFTHHEDSLGKNVVTLRFDNTGKLLSQSVTEYDSRNLVCRALDPLQNATVSQYDEAGRLVLRIAPDTTETSYEYQSETGVLLAVETIGDDGTGSSRRLARTEYRYNLRRERVAEIRCELDANGDVILKPDGEPAGLVTAFDPDPEGNIHTTITPAGHAFETFHDPLNRPDGTLDPLGALAITQYDPAGNIAFFIDSAGNGTEFQYDKLNRQVRRIDGEKNTIENQFDEIGRTIHREIINLYANVPDPATSYRYNLFGETVRQINAPGTADEVDSWFNRTPNGQIGSTVEKYTSDVEDASDTENLPADAALTTYAHDGNGQITDITDPKNAQFGSEYDAAGRLIKSTDADLTTAEYRYDSVGNLMLEKKRDNTVIVRIYDGLARLCEIRIFPLGATAFADLDLANLPTNTLQQKFVYDSYSRLTQAIDYNADGTGSPHTVDFVYDGNGNLTLETQDTDAPVRVVYDAADNPVELHYPDTENQGDYLGHVTINRDEGHRPDLITWTLSDSPAPEPVCDYTSYNGRNEPVAATIGSDIEYNRQMYGPGMEFSREFKWLSGGEILQSFTGTMDGQSVVPAFNEHGHPEETLTYYAQFSSPNQYDWKLENSYGYDPRARLDDADETVTFSGNTSTDTRTWQLDKVGNWDTTDAGNWTPNADNEYPATPHGSPAYDTNGNLIGFDGKTFIYDWANRLVEVQDSSDDSTIAEYSYDALGRRVTKYVADSATTTRYIHSGSQLIEELEDTGTGYELTKTYIHTTSIDRPLAVKHWSSGAVTSTCYFLADRQGSILALMQDNGTSPSTIVETYSYTPYGERRIYHYDLDYGGGNGFGLDYAYAGDGLPVEHTTSLIGNDIGFTGRCWDAESSLWHYRNRQYSPTLGRFLTRDPAGYIDGLNLYQYVRSNPLAYTDPWGLGTNPILAENRRIDDMLWYDKVSYVWNNIATDTKQDILATSGEAGWVGAGTINTSIDYATGFITFPSRIGHLGEGTGEYAADPSWENLPKVGGDVLTVTEVFMIAGSGLPSAKAPLFSGNNSSAAGTQAGSAMAKRLDDYAYMAGESAQIAETATIVQEGASIYHAAAASGGVQAVNATIASKGPIPSAGGTIRQFEQQGAKTYYRVYSGDATTGSWLTSSPPKSSAWAREALALPPWNEATHIQKVAVPHGTLLERSRAISVPEWGRLRGGAEQFKLLEAIPDTNFGPGRALP